MPRIAKELGPLSVKKLIEPGYHAVGGVPGLMLQISKTVTKSWVLRAKVGDKRREIGLGAYPGVGVAEARTKAQQARDKIKDGIDPVAERVINRQAIVQHQIDEKAMAWTFKRCAESYIKAKEPGWRNAKHGQQWKNTLATYAYPSIGEKLVSTITSDDVMAIIEPHWTSKTETISRVRNRIELVLDWATVMKYRTGDNPARWKGKLDKLLAERSKVAPVVGHRSLPHTQVAAFLIRLRKLDGVAARCLEFVALTVCRSGEARLATWSEFDLAAGVWAIPGNRMKSGRPHRVPLSDEVLTLLAALREPEQQTEALVFPGRAKGAPLSDMAMTKIMRTMGVDAVPHGFRASFSSWCAAETAYSFEVREMCLAHAIGDDTVGAYQRSDLFHKRAELMADWSKVCTAPPTACSINEVD